MAIALASLLAGQTKDETLTTLVALALVAGFPATSWQAGSVPRTFFELEALPYSDLTQVIASIASGGFVDYAEGPWLTLRAAQFYSVQRQPAVYTRGTIRLTDAGGVGPLTISAENQIYVESGGIRFRNITTGTLALGGTLDLVFEAEFAGADGNIADGADWTLSTTIAGITVASYAAPGGTWISQQGTDEESDPALRTRCKARWGELGFGATEAAYRFWAATASAEVTRVAVTEAPGDGIVSLYVAGNAGPISGGGLTAVQAYINARRPQCVRPTAYNASLASVVLTGTVKVQKAQRAAAEAAAQAAVVALFSTIPIGGVVYRAPVEAAILGANPGLINVVLDLAPETALSPTQVPVVSFSLTWIEV